jgi:hypothetical protein
MIEPCPTCKEHPDPQKVPDRQYLWRIECCKFRVAHGWFEGVITAWNELVKTNEMPWK